MSKGFLITRENHESLLQSFVEPWDDSTYTSASWRMVFALCIQNGMSIDGKTGIESVVCFIEDLLKSKQSLENLNNI